MKQLRFESAEFPKLKINFKYLECFVYPTTTHYRKEGKIIKTSRVADVSIILSDGKGMFFSIDGFLLRYNEYSKTLRLIGPWKKHSKHCFIPLIKADKTLWKMIETRVIDQYKISF